MIKRIIAFFIICVVILANCVNSYYNFENTFCAFNLNRNNIPANMIISYNKSLPTNQDVEMNVDFDKVVTIIGDNGGVTLSEDGKQISKIFTENEANSLLIRDEDFNYQTLDYNVNWIDKISPIISGAEDGNTYNSDIHLEYFDDVGLNEIYADCYSDTFSVYSEVYDFCEQNNIKIVSSNRNSITAYVLSNTKEIEKYNYYLDGVLKETTHEKKYVFTDLEYSDIEHHIVVEGLDRFGNVVETKEMDRKTIPLDEISISGVGNKKYVYIYGVPENLSSITTYVWCNGKSNSMLKFTPTKVSSNSYYALVDMARHRNYVGQYIVRFEIKYIENGVQKTKDIVGYIYMPSVYEEFDYSGLPNDFVENGNYYVRCTDAAGNEAELDFTIQK